MDPNNRLEEKREKLQFITCEPCDVCDGMFNVLLDVWGNSVCLGCIQKGFLEQTVKFMKKQQNE